MDETLKLSNFVADLEWDAIPPETIKNCKIHLLDTLGVGIQGSLALHSRQTVNVVQKLACSPQATVFGHSFKTSAVEAAFLNAIMAHSIDFDDGHKFVHPGCVIIPTAISVAEQHHLNGKMLIAGILTGYEVSIRISLAAGITHRQKGYHPTGSCNVFGSAAAASKLLGLEAAAINAALGLACTQAAGLTQYRYDGSPNKHFHAGMAARSGLLSGLLAQEGFRGTNQALEGDSGFLNVMADGGDPGQLFIHMGKKFMIDETDIKPYPSCRQTHSPVDLILGAIQQKKVELAEIQEIILYTYNYAFKSWLVATDPPASKLQAMLNIPFCMAAALINGNLTLSEFEEDRLADAGVHELMKKIKIKSDDALTRQFPGNRGARIELVMRDGSIISMATDNPLGSPENPVTLAQVVTKFRILASPVLSKSQIDKIITAIDQLENLSDASQLAQLLSPSIEPPVKL